MSNSKFKLVGSGFAIILLIATLLFGFHVVPEGHVDVYYRFGKLLSDTSESGLGYKMPILTENHHISVIFQSDNVKNVKCQLKQGVSIIFENVEVFNILSRKGVIPVIKSYGIDYDEVLIYSNVRNYIGSICRRLTVDDILANFTSVQNDLTVDIQRHINTRLNDSSYLQILSTRLSIPVIPTQILGRYEKLEEEKINKRIAEMNKQVVIEKLSLEKEQSIIKNAILKETESTNSEIRLKDAETKAKAKEIEATANEKLLTDSYLTLKRIEALQNNSKLFFGISGEKMINVL
jgi:regulator of protease activity HflC (stomatin/prohibitin superfamily)